MIPQIRIEDFNYTLPDGRIAKYPLERRDMSKLLVYRDGKVSENCFRKLPEYIERGSLMVFNDTKVVPARLFFRRDSGARIEIFCLEPVSPAEYVTNFDAVDSCSWRCVVGNIKRWKGDVLHFDAPESSDEAVGMHLRARMISREERSAIVEFSWDGGLTFSRVLEICGKVPIPPYLNRDTEAIDLERYQTLYAHKRGSVAAPTAGLHFTDEVLGELACGGVRMENVCLHVGAGTFLPVKSETISGHPMHREPFAVSLSLLETLAEMPEDEGVVAVGTTSVRTLESLYYAGVGCIENSSPHEVEQWAPYNREYRYSRSEALGALAEYLRASGLDELRLGTRIIIVPGFRFRLVDRLVTNFHQPQSTLLLLVSAFVGGDWKTIYDYALGNAFRFLSYGDSSLLFRRDKF